jgi:hypothetical protein
LVLWDKIAIANSRRTNSAKINGIKPMRKGFIKLIIERIQSSKRKPFQELKKKSNNIDLL